MKTRTMILAAIVLGFFTIFSVNASPKNEKTATVQIQASETLKDMFRLVPFNNDLMGDEDQAQITVSFRINDQNQVTNIDVMGENERLVKYAYYKLSKKAPNLDLGLKKGNYQINLSFESIR